MTGMLAVAANQAAAQDLASTLLTGEVRFDSVDREKAIPKQFQLPDEAFKYELQWRSLESDKSKFGKLTFPSPVTTPHELNNTVHCEYFCPKGEGKRPAVIVLHILGGDFALSRLFCHTLVANGTAALFVKMPYYGERRTPGVDRRMISGKPDETVEGITQAVLDIRRAVSWLASREEVDAEKIGILGVSLGGITASLVAEVEPRIEGAVLLLAGGDLVKIAQDSSEFVKQRANLKPEDIDIDDFKRIIGPVDPLTYADRLKGRRILMLNAKEDEVIPKACTEALWTKAGEPEIHWYDGGHYSVVRHIPNALYRTSQFFAPKKEPKKEN